MSTTTLTPLQRGAASHLFAIRPPVVPGTRVVLSNKMREHWYGEVTDTMHKQKVTSPEQVKEFCDLAGVPE